MPYGYKHKHAQGPHSAHTWKIVTWKYFFDLILMLRKKCSSFHLVSFAPQSVRELAHHRASHWSGWIAGDSSSELRPSEEDPLTNPGSPSNRIDNSGAAAPTSPCANKFTIQTWTKVLKRNVRNTLICFYKKFYRGRIHRSPHSVALERNLNCFSQDLKISFVLIFVSRSKSEYQHNENVVLYQILLLRITLLIYCHFN